MCYCYKTHRLRQLEDELLKNKETATQQKQENETARKQLEEAQLSKVEGERRRQELESSFNMEKNRLKK